MSDGIKAACEEEEINWYQQKLKFYAEKSPQQVYNLISTFDEYMDRFIKSDPALTYSQWDRINAMREAIKIFKSTE